MAEATIIQDIGNWVSFTLSNKPEVLCWIDYEDWHFIKSGKYYSHRDKQNNTHYVRRGKNDGSNGTTCLHNDLVKAPEGLFHDHKNRIGTDNRKENIRFVTQSQNLANRRPIGKYIHAKREFDGILLPAYLSVTFKKRDKCFGIMWKKKYLGGSSDKLKTKNLLLQIIEDKKDELIYY